MMENIFYSPCIFWIIISYPGKPELCTVVVAAGNEVAKLVPVWFPAVRGALLENEKFSVAVVAAGAAPKPNEGAVDTAAGGGTKFKAVNIKS